MAAGLGTLISTRPHKLPGSPPKIKKSKDMRLGELVPVKRPRCGSCSLLPDIGSRLTGTPYEIQLIMQDGWEGLMLKFVTSTDYRDHYCLAGFLWG